MILSTDAWKQKYLYLLPTFLSWSVLTLQPGVHPALTRPDLLLHLGALLLRDHVALLPGEQLTFGNLPLLALLLGYGHTDPLLLLLTPLNT